MRETDRQTDRQTASQAGRQAGRQTDRQTDRPLYAAKQGANVPGSDWRGGAWPQKAGSSLAENRWIIFGWEGTVVWDEMFVFSTLALHTCSDTQAFA